MIAENRIGHAASCPKSGCQCGALARQVVTATEFDFLLESFKSGELSAHEAVSLFFQVASRLTSSLIHGADCPSRKVNCNCGQDQVEDEALNDWAVAAPYLQSFMGSQANPKNFPNPISNMVN